MIKEYVLKKMEGKKEFVGKLKSNFWDKNEKRVLGKIHNHSTYHWKREREKH